jgi:hypothetical protein
MSEQGNNNHRTLLRHLTAGGLAACPICAAVGKAMAGVAHHGAGVEGITWTVFGTPVSPQAILI